MFLDLFVRKVGFSLSGSKKFGSTWVALPMAEDGKKQHAMHSRSLFQAVTGRSALSLYQMLAAGFLKISIIVLGLCLASQHQS